MGILRARRSGVEGGAREGAREAREGAIDVGMRRRGTLGIFMTFSAGRGARRLEPRD